MARPPRTIESLETIRSRFRKMDPKKYFAAVMDWLAKELRKPIRNQDWVAMAVIRQVGFEKGFYHHFERAYDYTQISIAEEETPVFIRKAMDIEARSSDSLKGHPDRSIEFEKM